MIIDALFRTGKRNFGIETGAISFHRLTGKVWILDYVWGDAEIDSDRWKHLIGRFYWQYEDPFANEPRTTIFQNRDNA